MGIFDWFKRSKPASAPAAKPSPRAAPAKAAPAASPRAAAAPAQSDRCTAVTKGGSRCQRTAAIGGDRCGLHKPKAAATTTVRKAPAAKSAPKAAKVTKAAKAAATCQAMTGAGTSCKNGSRDGSKYCGKHKGYRASAPVAKAPAKKPVATKASTAAKKPAAAKAAPKKAAAKKPAAKKPAAKKPAAVKTNGAAKSHFDHNGYKLYQNGNRYYFSKKSQAEMKKGGAGPVYALPAGKTVTTTPNGLPILKNK